MPLTLPICNVSRANICRIMFWKRGLYVISFIGLAFSATAQKSDFDSFLGPVQEEERGLELLQLFGHADDHFYALYGNMRRMRKFTLVKVSTDSLKVRSRTEFKFPEIKGMPTYYAFTFSTKDNDYIIATADDGKTGEVFIFAFEIQDDATISPTPITIGQGKALAMNYDDGFTIFLSEDGRRTVMLIPDEPDSFKNEKIQVRVFDGKFSLLQSGMLRLPYPAGQTLVEKAISDTAGHVHLLTSIAEEAVDKQKKYDNREVEYTLVSYDPTTDRVSEKFLSLGDKKLYDAQPVINDEGNLQVAGFYGNMLNANMAGTFSLEVDATNGTILNYGMYPFGRDFRLRFRADVRQKESESGRFDLDLVQAFGKDTLQMISEMRYSQTATVFNPASGTYSTIEINNFDEILITRIAPDSRIINNTLIPKMQSSSREEGKYISYVSYLVRGKTYLIFNDNERNDPQGFYDGTTVRPLTGSSSARPAVVSVDEEGRAFKRPLIASGTQTFVLFAAYYHATPSAMILTLYSGSKIRFAKIERNEGF